MMTTTIATDGAAAACPPALVPSSYASAIKLPCGVGSFLDFRAYSLPTPQPQTPPDLAATAAHYPECGLVPVLTTLT
ncbi:Os11g0230000 [Oryza sativa Japonica Group]|uniref:Os11g0230000 protein n=1 Tax=Oryza sativa subsp. japonica TaxID=39947 RepID=A0A0P0Y0J0_ORYSJ|nr:Os11g0230000 [Oryza sativa Japonica Group]